MRIDKNKKTIIYIIILVLAAAANYYFFSRNFGQDDSIFNLAITNLDQTISSQYAVSSKISALEFVLFSELRQYGDWPVEIPAQIGRINPFVPLFNVND